MRSLLGAFALVGVIAGAFVAWRKLAGGESSEWETAVDVVHEPTPLGEPISGVTPLEGPGRLIRPALDGLVPYEPGKPVETVQRELGLARVVKLASNEGPFGPFPEAIEAIERALVESNRYPDGGCYRLREVLAARHGVAFEEIVVAAGADAVIGYVCQAVLDPGDEIVTPWPSFPSYVLDPLKLAAVPVARASSPTGASTSTHYSPPSRSGRSSPSCRR